MKTLFGLAFAATLSLVGCPEIEPATGPGTDYPCGVGRFVCGDDGAPASALICCVETDVCEHHPARCEHFGPEVEAKKPDAGADAR